MNNTEIANLVGDLAFVVVYVAIAVLRRALPYFERLLLAGAKRFCSWIRRCSLRSRRPIEYSRRAPELVSLFYSNIISSEFADARARLFAGSVRRTRELPKVFLPFRFG